MQSQQITLQKSKLVKFALLVNPGALSCSRMRETIVLSSLSLGLGLGRLRLWPAWVMRILRALPGRHLPRWNASSGQCTADTAEDPHRGWTPGRSWRFKPGHLKLGKTAHPLHLSGSVAWSPTACLYRHFVFFFFDLTWINCLIFWFSFVFDLNCLINRHAFIGTLVLVLLLTWLKLLDK